jgi:hypothetical protein
MTTQRKNNQMYLVIQDDIILAVKDPLVALVVLIWWRLTLQSKDQKTSSLMAFLFLDMLLYIRRFNKRFQVQSTSRGRSEERIRTRLGIFFVPGVEFRHNVVDMTLLEVGFFHLRIISL